MVGPDYLIRFLCETNQMNTHQRGRRKIKTLSTIFRQQSFQAKFLLSVREPAVIMQTKRQLDLLMHDLKRRFQAFPAKGYAQYFVMIDYPLPSLLKSRHVK